MHIDLFHALVATILILGALWGMRRGGLISDEWHRGWNWTVFIVILVVMFVFNLIWPYDGAP